MSQKRLSERMSDTTNAVDDAQDALQAAVTKAISTHFEAGIEFERERIIKLLEVEADEYDQFSWPMAGSPLRTMAKRLKGEQA